MRKKLTFEQRSKGVHHVHANDKSVACVFLPEHTPDFGAHSEIDTRAQIGRATLVVVCVGLVGFSFLTLFWCTLHTTCVSKGWCGGGRLPSLPGGASACAHVISVQ